MRHPKYSDDNGPFDRSLGRLVRIAEEEITNAQTCYRLKFPRCTFKGRELVGFGTAGPGRSNIRGPALPIEFALAPGTGRNWRAAESGEQTILLILNQPQRLRTIWLRFVEGQAVR